jgi:hypothetical protein
MSEPVSIEQAGEGTSVPTHNVLEVSKRVGKELERLPLESHAAVVAILQTLMQHRGVLIQNDRQAKANQEEIRKHLSIR